MRQNAVALVALPLFDRHSSHVEAHLLHVNTLITSRPKDYQFRRVGGISREAAISGFGLIASPADSVQ